MQSLHLWLGVLRKDALVLFPCLANICHEQVMCVHQLMGKTIRFPLVVVGRKTLANFHVRWLWPLTKEIKEPLQQVCENIQMRLQFTSAPLIMFLLFFFFSTALCPAKITHIYNRYILTKYLKIWVASASLSSTGVVPQRFLQKSIIICLSACPFPVAHFLL